MIETKNKILDTAERLFGENGYDATSLRQIIAAAGVNLAAIHYHFGSKEELLDELVLRKAQPVNQLRIALLDKVLAEAGSGRPPLERVLDAFLGPMSDAADQNPQFVRVMGRLHAEGLLPSIVQRHFQPLFHRLQAAIQRALPDLPEQELLWRMHFMFGAMAHTMCGTPDSTGILKGGVAFHERIERLIAFLSGGFRAPLPKSVAVEIEVG
ncbi:MAG TPA: TetR/AcrR family transcriptional regulator [Bryobacteraceae bacterium]|nr:TetR/AcrR family transcriptional regulator [Bryobacteraceae bacterium]